MKKRLAHIINPFIAGDESDLAVAQPITFESMKGAKEYALEMVDVKLYAAFFPEDESIVPNHLIKTLPLKQSVMELGEFRGNKRYPILKDILNRIQDREDIDYIVYSNVDIALVPDFYLEIDRIINKVYDGFVVNRRTISKKYPDVSQIPCMIEDARTCGTKHPGFDCFVFKKEIMQHFNLGTGCVGANWIGHILISNILGFSKKFKIFKDLSITFHIGDDGPGCHPLSWNITGTMKFSFAIFWMICWIPKRFFIGKS